MIVLLYDIKEREKKIKISEWMNAFCLGKIKCVELPTTVRSRMGAGLGGSTGNFASVVTFSSYGGVK